MNRLLSVGAVSLLFAGFAHGLETSPRGQLQIQATYFEPALTNDARWAMSMPNNWLGVTAVENVNTSAFVGHVQIGVDPLSDDSEVTLTPDQAYLSWNQGIVSLWAGRLPTLEQVYVEDLYPGLLSLENGGLGAANRFADSENKAVRLDARSGEYMVFSAQWQIDESTDDFLWHAAGAIQTNEGSISVTYRKADDEDALWANQITWLSGNVTLSGAWAVQDGIQEWDIEARLNSASVQSFIAYGRDSDDQDRWAIGVHQGLTNAMTNFSELVWWPDSEMWQWNTGFRLAF